MAKNKRESKALPRRERGRGRPISEAPKVTMSIRFSVELISELDAWALANGEMGRSAAIRLAVIRLVRGGGVEKPA